MDRIDHLLRLIDYTRRGRVALALEIPHQGACD
jgi:hypothetical protein